MFRRLFNATIWAEGALDEEPKKYRSLKRIWLPLYDVFAMWAGVNAMLYGSRLIDRIFGQSADFLGLTFTVIALSCLVGLAFPRLWLLEIISKVVMVGMIVGYMGCIVFAPSPAQLIVAEGPNWFIVTMLAFGLPLALFRLNMLAEERLQRRIKVKVDEKRQALLAAEGRLL